MMIIVAVLAICAVVSTQETRAAGALAVQPFARIAGWFTAGLIGLMLIWH